MQAFEKNIINLCGNRGKQWLRHLPNITQVLTDKWRLSNIQPVGNLTWNYVLKAVSEAHGPVVLKISCDAELIQNEVRALNHFCGHGMVKLIDYEENQHAILVQQAVPGRPLHTLPPEKIDEMVNAYATVVKRLTSVPQQNHWRFKHIQNWLEAIDRADEFSFPANLISKAIATKNRLLAAGSEDVILHGDLHCANILCEDKRWIAIDPKGVVGEIAFEAAKFNFIHEAEADTSNVYDLFEIRSKKLSQALQVDHQRLKDWVFVRLVLSACWFQEDHCDTSFEETIKTLRYLHFG